MKRWIILGLGIASLLTAEMMLEELGWVDEPGTRCLGHFSVDSEQIVDSGRINFESDAPSLWDGEAWVFDEPLRMKHKDSVFDLSSGSWYLKEKKWLFEDDNRLIRPPLRLMAQKGQYYPQAQSAQLQGIQFRIGPTVDYHLAIWGQAEDANWLGKTTTLRHVNMSICSPRRPLWGLSAQEAVFKHQDKTMYLKHVVANFFGVPVFYLPWLDLNLKRQRESGFLSPQIYLNRGTFFLTVPVYWNMASYADMTIAPLLSLQHQTGAIVQARYLSMWGLSEGNGFFVRDGGRNRFRLSNEMHWLAPNWDIEIKGYQVSDGEFIEDYPRFSHSMSWLIPWSARGRLHNASAMLEVGADSYQDFSSPRSAAVFAYYKRLPWLRVSSWQLWNEWIIKSSTQYARYVPTASYQDIFKTSKFASSTVGIGRDMHHQTGLWHGWMDVVMSRIDDESIVAHNARGMLSWLGQTQLGCWRLRSKLGILLGSVSGQQAMPLLESRPKVFTYDQLFQLDRFTLPTRVGDYRDLDWAIEGQRGGFGWGIGSRYAFRLHRVGVSDHVVIYDPLLVDHLSPVVTMASWQEGAWQFTGKVNLGRGDNFQYSQQINYHHSRIDLGLYAFKMPIDYPFYLTPEAVDNVSGLGVLWNLYVTDQWRLKWEWFSQLDQMNSGYMIALRYHDCCLQFGIGVKRSLLPIESSATARTQWFAEVDFDTGSGIADTVHG